MKKTIQFFILLHSVFGFSQTKFNLENVVKFQKEMAKYIPPKTKSTLQFPLGKSLPASLIAKIIKWRVKENLAKSKKK